MPALRGAENREPPHMKRKGVRKIWSGPCYDASRKNADRLVSTIAANVVTSGQQAVATSGSAASSTPDADQFAAILDQAVQDAASGATTDPSAVTTTSAASANGDTTDPSTVACAATPAASDNSTPASTDPSTDPNALIPADLPAPVATPLSSGAAAAAEQPDGSLALSILQDDDSQIPAQADAATAKPAAAQTDATPAQAPAPSLATNDDAADQVTPASDGATPGPAPAPTPAAKPQRIADHCHAHAEPAQTPAADPSDVQTPAQTAPVVAAATAAPVDIIGTASLQVAPAAAPAATQDDPADASSGDIAAAAMTPAGMTAKPGEPAKPQAGNTKTQTRQSVAAATLADADKAIARPFTDQKISSAPPAHGAAAPSKPAGPQPTDPSAAPGTASSPSTASASASASASNSAPATAPATPQPDAVAAPSAHAQVAPPQQQSASLVVAAPTAPLQAATPPAANAAVSAQLQIGHPAQPDIASLAFNIAARSQDGTKHFDIRLDPAELGRVDVHLSVDDSGKAQAMLSVEKPQTLELLQKDQPQLERALKDAGLDLTQNGLNFSLKGQQQQGANGDGNASNPRGRMLAARAIAAVDSAASTVSLGQVSASDTRLDIRV